MSASAAPPNRSRCRGTPARSAQDPNPAATPLCPCGDPRLHGEAARLALGYRSARRPTSSSAEIDATLEIVDFRQWPLLKLEHRRSADRKRCPLSTIFTGFVEPRSGMGY